MSQAGRFFSNSGSGGFIQTITGNDGIPAVPTAGNINVVGTGNITVTNTGVSTETISFTGVLPIANGGTNASSMTNTFGVNYFDGTRLVTTAVGTATNVLTSNGVGVAPTFQAIPASGVTSITGNTGGAQTGAITLTGGATGAAFGGAAGTITMTFAGITANGGTVSLATDATASAINIGTGAGVKTVILGSTNSTSTTTVNCGTGGANFGTSANAHATTIGSTTASATTTIQGPSAGVFAIGVAGVTPSNINMVTINTSTGQLGSQAVPSGLAWSVITANQTAAVNNGYFCNKAGTLALALPAASAVGDIIEVANINTTTGTQFTQAANQQIFFGNTSTTLGATGTLTSIAVGDTLKIVCRTANLVWQVTSAIGNWTPA